jgi:uracil-DNA glycosylase
MKPTDIMHPSWEPIRYLLNEPELVELRTEVLPSSLYYPELMSIFRVFKMPVKDINMVVLGQDPYHGMKQANGLCFAVQPHITMPPSLKIIQKELDRSCVGTNWEEEYKKERDHVLWKTLSHWEKQGVFLLNTALTVESGKPGSHLNYWKNFTKKVVSFIGETNPCVWLLWGAKAQSYRPYIGNIFDVRGYDDETIPFVPVYKDMNYIFSCPHPASELYNSKDAGFIGSNTFSYSNVVLKKVKNKIINW